MAWPEVAFLGEYDYAVRRVALSGDLLPYRIEVVSHDSVPRRLSTDTVAVVTDDRELRRKYSNLPTMCHERLGFDFRHLGKWSVMFNGVSLGHTGPIESFTGQVSDDAEVQQMCTLFLLIAIEHSLQAEPSVVSRSERAMIKSVVEQFGALGAAGVPGRTSRSDIGASITSIGLETRTRSPDRMIIRRSLQRLKTADGAAMLESAGFSDDSFLRLLRAFRIP